MIRKVYSCNTHNKNLPLMEEKDVYSDHNYQLQEENSLGTHWENLTDKLGILCV